MPSGTHSRWGEWIIERWAFLGFKRIADLSTAIGCSYAALYQWKQLETPPDAMQKGFDVGLIAALKTDRMTLFCSYVSIAPADAPVIEPPRDVDRLGSKRRILKAPAREVAVA
ncbi:MAG: hypothetical protein ABSB74_10275 [Tepidisphaeraceae bacterium]